MLATLVGLYVRPLNFGIDFTGGVLFEVKIPGNVSIDKMRHVFHDLGVGEITIQSVGNDNEFMIRTSIKDHTRQQHYVDLIKNALITQIDPSTDFRKIEFIGADIGEEMVWNCALALLFTFIGIVFYTWYRFNWQYSVGMLVSLVHDLVLTLGFLCLTQYEFNATSIAALLTILGFSVNDTVVVYDRIRENFHHVSKMSFESVINRSLNETLSRTTLTVVTTLLADAVLIFYGGGALKSFSITIFVGIVIGTYSSIFVASPMLLLFSPQKLK